MSEEKYIIYTQMNSKWVQYFHVNFFFSMISSQVHNLNSIKGKHQTNLDERLSTKWLAWNLPAVSSKAGRGRRMSSQNRERDPGVWAEQWWHPLRREGWVLQQMVMAHEEKWTLKERIWEQPVPPTSGPPLCVPGFLNSSQVIAGPSLKGTLFKLRKTYL